MDPFVALEALREPLTKLFTEVIRNMSTADKKALTECFTVALRIVSTAESTVTLGTEPMDKHTDTDTQSHGRCKCATVPCECGARCPVDSDGTVSTAGSGSASSRRPRSNTVAQKLDAAKSRTASASERSERVQRQPQTATAVTGWATQRNTLPLGMDEHGRTHVDWRDVDKRGRTSRVRKRRTQAQTAAALAAARSSPVRSGTHSRQYREVQSTGYNTLPLGMDEHGRTTALRPVRPVAPAVQRAVPKSVLSDTSATESSSTTCSTGRQGGRTGDIHNVHSLEHPSECRRTAKELAGRSSVHSDTHTDSAHSVRSATSTESDETLAHCELCDSSGTQANKEHGRCGSSTDSSGSTWSSVSQSGRTVTMADCAAGAAHHMAHCMRIGNSELRSVRRATVHNGEQLAELTDAMRTFFRVLANADTGAHSQQGHRHSRSHNSMHY